MATTLMLGVGGAAMLLISSARGLYDLDRERTRLNQGLKASRDFLAVDVRQAGERLPADFPAIEVIRGEDLPGGATGDPDRLVVRRNLVSTVLRSCREVSGTGRRIYLSELIGPPPPGCNPVPDGDGDGWPDNHQVWHEFRVAHGDETGAVWAYIYDPVTGNGEFFEYWRDGAADGYLRTPAGQSWQFSYPVANQARVYLLEERRYQVNANTLQIVVNREDAEATNIADDILDFQLLAHLEGLPPSESLGPADPWTSLHAIEVAVQGRSMDHGRVMERSVTTMLTPRNVLSR